MMKWIREKHSSLLSVIESFSREVDEKFRGKSTNYIFLLNDAAYAVGLTEY
jgi:hypothetical protein